MKYTKAMRAAYFYRRMNELGFSYEEADKLRLIEKTLSRWSALECGGGNDYASWAIERDTDSYIVCSQGNCGKTSFCDTVTARSGNCPACGDCAPLKRHIATGRPYMVTHPHTGKSYRRRIADREAGALRRLQQVMAAHPELWFYHQGDPRGCALYIGRRTDLEGNEIVDKAKRHGFQFVLSTRGESGDSSKPPQYTCPQLPGRIFSFPEEAAVPFLKSIGEEVPASRNLPLDSHYTRGIAVCID